MKEVPQNLNYKKLFMSQSRLSGLALQTIENEMVSEIHFEDVINDCDALKSRRRKL